MSDGDTGSSLYLSKEVRRQVYQIISDWFSKFNSGSLLPIFRLLVPEVMHPVINNAIGLIHVRRTLEEFII